MARVSVAALCIDLSVEEQDLGSAPVLGIQRDRERWGSLFLPRSCPILRGPHHYHLFSSPFLLLLHSMYISFFRCIVYREYFCLFIF